MKDLPFSWVWPDKFPVGSEVRVKSGSINPENFSSYRSIYFLRIVPNPKNHSGDSEMEKRKKIAQTQILDQKNSTQNP